MRGDCSSQGGSPACLPVATRPQRFPTERWQRCGFQWERPSRVAFHQHATGLWGRRKSCGLDEQARRRRTRERSGYHSDRVPTSASNEHPQGAAKCASSVSSSPDAGSGGWRPGGGQQAWAYIDGLSHARETDPVARWPARSKVCPPGEQLKQQDAAKKSRESVACVVRASRIGARGALCDADFFADSLRVPCPAGGRRSAGVRPGSRASTAGRSCARCASGCPCCRASPDQSRLWRRIAQDFGFTGLSTTDGNTPRIFKGGENPVESKDK